MGDKLKPEQGVGPSRETRTSSVLHWFPVCLNPRHTGEGGSSILPGDVPTFGCADHCLMLQSEISHRFNLSHVLYISPKDFRYSFSLFDYLVSANREPCSDIFTLKKITYIMCFEVLHMVINAILLVGLSSITCYQIADILIYGQLCTNLYQQILHVNMQNAPLDISGSTKRHFFPRCWFCFCNISTLSVFHIL